MKISVHGEQSTKLAVCLGMLWGFVPRDRHEQAIPVLRALLQAMELSEADVELTVQLLTVADDVGR